jgi:L-fuconolactonase
MFFVDGHHHVWDLTRADYPWLGPELGDLHRSVGLDELIPMLDEAGIDRTVLVQASDNAEDTASMLELATARERIGAVVGWVPLDQPAQAERALAELRRHPKFRGVRPGIHFLPDPEWLLRPEVGASLTLLEAAGLTLDVVSVRRRHLELVPVLAERHPRLRMVIDHLSKPPIRKPDWEPWRSNLIAAARFPHVYAKISGLFPARGPMTDWDAALLRPYVDLALEHFGAPRLMFGSDWPICDLAGGFGKIWREYNLLFDALDPPDRARILGGTAAEFYRIVL